MIQNDKIIAILSFYLRNRLKYFNYYIINCICDAFQIYLKWVFIS